jgi:hypothetical protein
VSHVKLRAASDEPLVEVSVVDSLGQSHVFKPDKSGAIEVDENFQEVVARLFDAGFAPETYDEKEPD